MKAIVTGANGFVGSATVKKLVSMGISVLAIDLPDRNNNLDLTSGQIEFLPLLVENIEDLKTKVVQKDYALFYHFAWKGSAGDMRFDPNVQLENALTTVKCLRIAHDIGCQKFICAGTIMEYEVTNVMYSQGSKPGLGYIYGVGKQTAHGLCKPIANHLGIDLVWAYITNAYGVGELSPRFLNSTLRKIIHNQALEFTSATQNYDFIYVDDVAEAFYLLGVYGESNEGYLIGSGNAKPLKEFIFEIADSLHVSSPLIFGNVPFTGVNLDLDVFSTKKIQKLGFNPKISFAEGVKRTYEWLKTIEVNR